MTRSRWLESFARDGRLTTEASQRTSLSDLVPSCPGWSVADLLSHTANVYLHKVACIELAGTRPTAWERDSPDGDVLAWHESAHRRILALLTAADPQTPSWTWWPPDQSVGFWNRRMAQEAVIHRVDAELAAGGPVTPIEPDLAADGVDECLVIFLAFGLGEDPLIAGDGCVICMEANDTGDTWYIQLNPSTVVIDPEGPDRPAELTISGTAEELLLWMWGRTEAAPAGSEAPLGRRLRELLAMAT